MSEMQSESGKLAEGLLEKWRRVMTHNEMIAVIAAHRDGKTVQFQRTEILWEDAKYPSWNFLRCNYREKPDAVEKVVIETKGESDE